MTGPQIAVTSLRQPSGRYLDWIDDACFSTGGTVSVRTAVRNQSGQPIVTLPQFATASTGRQFAVSLLGQSISAMETVTAQDPTDGLTGNPLTFDLPLPLYGPAFAVQ